MKQYKFIIFAILAIFSFSFFVSCDKNDAEVKPGQTIDEIINTNADYSLFAYAIKKAKLDYFTKGGGPFTFYVPTNTAFGRLSVNGQSLGSEAGINSLDSNLLVQILTYHFHSGTRTYPEIPLGPNASISTQGGRTIYASRYEDGESAAYLNGTRILNEGTGASNGIIYPLDNVLMPPLYSVADFLRINGYSLMLQAINKTATLSSFTATPTTTFAVPNSVMIAKGYDSVSIANLSAANTTALGNILRYHAIPQRIFVSEFKNSSYLTRLSAKYLSVQKSGTSLSVKGSANTGFANFAGNYNCTNGVLYAVDSLLRP